MTQHAIATVQSLGCIVRFGTPTAWLSETLAPFWREQAVLAAQDPVVASAKRKEIVFAVATAECFLIEWVRDQVFQGDVGGCDAYFQVRRQKGVRERWKEITKDLASQGRIASHPDFATSTTWGTFSIIVETRNAMMHGNYSRPRNTRALPGTTALTPEDLLAKPPRWAINTVCDVAKELCTTAGTSPPSWL